MNNKELQSICGRVKNLSKRLSMSLAPLGYNYVIFNNPQHIFENIRKYEEYADRDVANFLDGIVRNADGKLEPQCGYSITEIYADIYDTPKWVSEIKGKWKEGMLVIPYEVGDIIEYYKKDEDGDEHRCISNIVLIDGTYQIFGDENIDLDSITIAIRRNEDVAYEIEQLAYNEKWQKFVEKKNPYIPLIERLEIMLDRADELSDYFEAEHKEVSR